MRIVLDGMGSDHYPGPEVEAAIQAAKKWNDEIILVGKIEILEPELSSLNIDNAPVKIVDAPEVYSMDAKLTHSSLRKAQTSMAVGIRMLKDGEADAFVTAGNTGGAMANGLAQLGRIRGIKRPALCALVPVKTGKAVVLDIGANAECKPLYLFQFAIMGSIYANKMRGISNPKVAILSNGEEEGKGNDLVKASYPLLKESGLNFIGNVEGKELFGGEADVIVTDGFTGNVLIKSSEAVAKLMSDWLKEGLMSSPLTKIGALLAKPAFDRLKKEMDPSEIGAAPLLGLNGLVFVGHGRSDAKALVSAIGAARQAVSSKLLPGIQSSIENQISKIK